jgi:hypothetical protein
MQLNGNFHAYPSGRLNGLVAIDRIIFHVAVTHSVAVRMYGPPFEAEAETEAEPRGSSTG